jgi:hypothetical protein
VAFEIFGAIMPHGSNSGKARKKTDSGMFSVERNDSGWVGRNETHQSLRVDMMAVASLHPPPHRLDAPLVHSAATIRSS